jgi:hypothetical protein
VPHPTMKATNNSTVTNLYIFFISILLLES